MSRPLSEATTPASVGSGSTDIHIDTIEKNGDVEANASALEVQAGVKNIEAVSMTWTKWALIVAYVRFVTLKPT